MIIYFDMDGTIADYEKRFIEIWGEEVFKKFQKMTKEEKKIYQMIMADQGFYEELEPMPMFDRMHTLWKQGHTVAILTSVGKIESTAVATQKLKWLETHCPKEMFEDIKNRFYWVTSSKAKAMYAEPNAILVDDREKAWRPFLEAGGSVVIVR